MAIKIGGEYMHPSEIIAKNVHLINGKETGKCSICGRFSDYAFLKSESISSSFNDYQYFKYNTDFICEYCNACLSNTGFDGKALRNYSIIANESKYIILNKPAIIYHIDNQFSPPYIFMVSFSKKKHIFLHTKINYDQININISTDRYDLSFTKEQFNNIYIPCSDLYNTGFSKMEIETGIYRKWKLMDQKRDFFILDKEINKYRGTNLLNFVLYALSKEDEDNIEA